MPEKTPGDPNITKLFGFPGYEALIRVTLKHINIVKAKQGLTQLTYAKFISEIQTKSADIKNTTP